MKTVQESMPMRLARRLGSERIAWSLRRFHCPVPADALVLEVGSGGNPYARANVLLDAYEHTRERHWAPLVSDRPTVLGFVEDLPFRDGAFDFVIASHVLEHSTDPARFLSELQRVASAGYIEVPDAFMERVNPYKDHRLEITVRDGRLLLRKKPAWQLDPQLVELYEHRVKRWMTSELIPEHPFDFHVRYYWSHRIDFEIVDEDVDATWEAPTETRSAVPAAPNLTLRGRIQKLGRSLLSQRRRNRTIDMVPLLRCPVCHGTELRSGANAMTCAICNTAFPVAHGIPRLVATLSEPAG
jgi:SAM-dependent methyltransferase